MTLTVRMMNNRSFRATTFWYFSGEYLTDSGKINSTSIGTFILPESRNTRKVVARNDLWARIVQNEVVYNILSELNNVNTKSYRGKSFLDEFSFSTATYCRENDTFKM